MRLKFSLLTTFATLIATIGTANADDTDIYINGNASLPGNSLPMVMFSIDYRPNLGSTSCGQGQCDTLIAEGYMSPTGPYTYFDVLRGAIRKVFDPLEGIKVGLMLNHDNGTKCNGFGKTGCSGGGYIAMGFEEFLANDANGAKARFADILDNMPTPGGNVSHSYQGKELFFELFRYLTGQGVYNAHNGYTDYGSKNKKKNLDQEYPGASWDTSIEVGPANGPDYLSPLQSAGACSSIYTINAMFQVSNQEADSDSAIQASVGSGGFGSSQKDFPDVIQYMNDADLANGNYGTVPDLDDKQNVTSYFLIDGKHINNTTTSYAKAGGTGLPLELSEEPDELVATLQEIFKQILSVSTTFVAASVPVNVFNRAEITDNVYVALFQVDGQGKPSWVGNVKKLKLVGANMTDGGGALVDMTGYSAVAGDGRIRFDALTHWTSAEDLPAPDEDAGEVAGRDGRAVARGGAGQKIPGFINGSPQLANGLGGRTMYYDKTTSSLAELNVDSTTASQLMSDFGVSSVADAGDMIAFTRGNDVDDLDNDTKTNEARDWIYGDSLHSRPMPLNYGALGGYSAENPAIYIAVASNDGALRMIRNTTVGNAESGEEAWAFVPRRSMGAQKTLRDNVPGTPHPYTFDGAPVAYIADQNHNGSIESGDNVWLFTGMRRGGKAYYALDVTDPEAPRLMWTIDDSGDFSELGYTFSNPRVGLVKTGSGATPVIMFGGGYDMNKDSRSGIGSNDTMGNAIYVVNAETGQLIWKATGGNGASTTREFQHPDLDDSIPSTLTTADTDGDGYTDRIIVGDTGGNVWRADLTGSDTSDWKLTQLAALGRHSAGASGKGTDLRFFHRPDLVQAKDDDGPFDAVLIGSGDRADPLDGGGTATNYFYMIKDRNTGVGSGTDSPVDHLMLDDITSNCIQSGTCTPDLEYGWKLKMEDSGEKILATPLTVSGKVFFTSYMPQGGSRATTCSPSEGAGHLYAVSLQNGSAVINYDTSDDTPSDDDPEGDDPTSKNDRRVELNSAGIPAEVVTIPPNKILRPDLQVDTIDVATRWRTYWFVAEDSDL